MMMMMMMMMMNSEFTTMTTASVHVTVFIGVKLQWLTYLVSSSLCVVPLCMLPHVHIGLVTF